MFSLWRSPTPAEKDSLFVQLCLIPSSFWVYYLCPSLGDAVFPFLPPTCVASNARFLSCVSLRSRMSSSGSFENLLSILKLHSSAFSVTAAMLGCFSLISPSSRLRLRSTLNRASWCLLNLSLRSSFTFFSMTKFPARVKAISFSFFSRVIVGPFPPRCCLANCVHTSGTVCLCKLNEVINLVA